MKMKMKKNTLILILLLNFTNLFSQNNWEYYFRINTGNNGYGYDEGLVDIHEINNGDIISIGYRYFDYYHKNDTKTILRLHNGKTGKVYKEVEYSIDSLETILHWIFYDKETGIFTIVGSGHYIDVDKNIKRGYFLLTQWDKDLKLIKESTFRLKPKDEDLNLWYFSGHYTEDGKYLVYCLYNENIEDVSRGNYKLLLKIDKLGNIIKEKIYSDKIDKTPNYTLIEDKKNNQYLMLGSSKTYYLDKDFEKVDSAYLIYISKYFNAYHTTAKMLSPDTLLLTARINDFHRGMALLTTDMKYVNSVDLTTKEDPGTIEFLLGRRSMDYIDTSNVFVASQEYHFDYYSVSKVNSKLTPYWIKYCSENDTLRHFLWSIIATLDRGCIIAGTRDSKGDNVINSGKNGAWMQKFDSEGNTVSTTELAPNAWSITVYPNPSPGKFKINIDGKTQDTKLELYDMQGKVVKRFTGLIQGENRLYMYDIPHGIYVWQLSRAGKILGTGKWVKE